MLKVIPRISINFKEEGKRGGATEQPRQLQLAQPSELRRLTKLRVGGQHKLGLLRRGGEAGASETGPSSGQP